MIFMTTIFLIFLLLLLLLLLLLVLLFLIIAFIVIIIMNTIVFIIIIIPKFFIPSTDYNLNNVPSRSRVYGELLEKVHRSARSSHITFQALHF